MPSKPRLSVPEIRQKFRRLTDHPAIRSRVRLAAMMGCSPASLTSWEKTEGDPRGPSLPADQLDALAACVSGLVQATADDVLAALRAPRADALAVLLDPPEGRAWETVLAATRPRVELRHSVLGSGLHAVEQDVAGSGGRIAVNERFRLYAAAPNLSHVRLFCRAGGAWQYLGAFGDGGVHLAFPPEDERPYRLTSFGSHRFVVVASHLPLPAVDAAPRDVIPFPKLDAFGHALERAASARWTWGDLVLVGEPP